MKETYLSRDFRETAAQCFPSQAKELNAFFDARLNVLLAENADASKEKQYHLKRQILPGIAAYETLQRAMPKEEVWGDRIFEKCGIRRDEEGDGGKTLEIRGKRRLSARDGGANYQQS